MTEPKLTDAGQIQVRQVTGVDRERALSVLLSGRAGASTAAVEQFLRYARQNHLDLRGLWVAEAAGTPQAAVLVVPGAGRTAMAFLSPLGAAAQVVPAATVIRQAAARQDPREMRLIQVLLDPGQQWESDALVQAGFRRLANLIYMERLVDSPGREIALGPDERLMTWSEINRSAFSRAIVASYEKTLDCPGLLGLRHVDDIIAGHMATGQFDPALWMAVYEGDTPVAVMLLSGLPQRRSLELVYLGVSQPQRGRGWGRRLLDHALFVARQRRYSRVLLAVDEHNTPAVRLYRSMRFKPTARRTALILPLGEPAPAA